MSMLFCFFLVSVLFFLVCVNVSVLVLLFLLVNMRMLVFFFVIVNVSVSVLFLFRCFVLFFFSHKYHQSNHSAAGAEGFSDAAAASSCLGASSSFGALFFADLSSSCTVMSIGL